MKMKNLCLNYTNTKKSNKIQFGDEKHQIYFLWESVVELL